MTQDMLLYWSGGKDCAVALHELNTNPRYGSYHVTDVLTTLTLGYDRISGHGVRGDLLERQVECLGLNLHKTYIPQRATMSDYDSVIEAALLTYRERGTAGAATGDIFVEKRRMATFKKLRISGCFPLMRVNPHEHMTRLIELGFKAYVVCVDSAALDESFVGKVIDREFLNRLPIGVDPCGENGEFHTFVFDGPIFKRRLRCRLGQIVFRESFYYSDVLPDD
jgi:uncharacterized protein (TIGR00290 family)